MKNKPIHKLILLTILIVSGPLYMTLALLPLTNHMVRENEFFKMFREKPFNGTNEELIEDITDYEVVYSNYTDPEESSYKAPEEEGQPLIYLRYHDRKPVKKPQIQFSADQTEGSSPFFVTFTTQTGDTRDFGGILIYKYDFDGDGTNDFACFENKEVTHVYTVEEECTLRPTVTVMFKNGYSASKTLTLHVRPVDPEKWFSIKQFGYTRFGIQRNGTVWIYDERYWIPVTLKINGERLQDPNITEINEGHSLLIFNLSDSEIELNITYRVAGSIKLEFKETLKKDSPLFLSDLPEIELPDVEKGRLDFKPKRFTQIDSTSRVLTIISPTK